MRGNLWCQIVHARRQSRYDDRLPTRKSITTKFFLHDVIFQNNGRVRRITKEETVLQPETPYFRELYVLFQEHWREIDRKEFPYGFSFLGPGAYDEIVYP